MKKYELTEEGKELAKFARLNPSVMMWVESFASCAIEGNKSAEHMMELWNNNREQFILELSRDWLDK